MYTKSVESGLKHKGIKCMETKSVESGLKYDAGGFNIYDFVKCTNYNIILLIRMLAHKNICIQPSMR